MILATIEAELNRNIVASAAARSACARLNGRSLSIKLTGMPLVMTLIADSTGIQLKSTEHSAPDVTLTGSPLSLLSLVRRRETSPIGDSNVRLEGNVEVAHAFSELLKLIKPDGEEIVSRWVGDTVAYRLGATARRVTAYAKHVGDTALRNMGEYLQEEGRDVPAPTEVDEFVRGVDQARDAVARLQARVSQLEKRRASTAAQHGPASGYLRGTT